MSMVTVYYVCVFRYWLVFYDKELEHIRDNIWKLVNEWCQRDDDLTQQWTKNAYVNAEPNSNTPMHTNL